MLSTILIFLPALALASPVRPRQAQPSTITILDAQTSGNGCPQGTVSTSLSPDGTVVTFGFDSFYAYIGPAALQSDKTKACQIHLDLQYPGGFQYAIVDAVYHGYARLDPGVTGTFLSTYYFSQSAAQTAETRSNITGPAWVEGNVYTKEDDIESTATIWSPCGDTGILNVNNRIALTANSTTGTGELSDDDATVSFTHQLHVSWQACTPGAATGGGGFQTGSGSTTVTPREPQVYTIGGGTSTLTPGGDDGGSTTTITVGGGGGTTVISPREPQVYTIGPGSSTLTPGGDDGGSTTTITVGGGGGTTVISPREE